MVRKYGKNDENSFGTLIEPNDRSIIENIIATNPKNKP